MKPLPKIARCRCGRKARLTEAKKFYVACPKWECWCGPTRKTKRGAILAWNKVMEKA